MSFTKQLFKMTSMALPGVTARKFSRYLGKSEGYYGSISAQNLAISTNGLLFLSEVLEQHNTRNQDSEGNQYKYITEIQNLIAQEIARRMQQLDTENLAVRKMVIRAVAQTYMQSGNDYSAPPIVIC
jgi:hypothetical protein